MKLMTKAIENKLSKYPLYSQDGKKENAICVAKFFLCVGAWTWYILEREDDTLYGIVVNGQGECEFSYFSLSELQNLRATRLRLTVERDLSFKPMKLKDIKDSNLQKFLNYMYA